MANGEDLSLERLLEYAYGTPTPSQTDIRFREDLAAELEGLTSTPQTRTFEDYDMSDSSITMFGPSYIAANPLIDGITGTVSTSGNNGGFAEPVSGETRQELFFNKQAVQNMKFGNGFVDQAENFEWNTNSLDHNTLGFGTPISVANYFFDLNPEDGQGSQDNLTVEYSDEYGVKRSSPIVVSKNITFANVDANATDTLVEITDGGQLGISEAEVTVDVQVLWNFDDKTVGNVDVSATVVNSNSSSSPTPSSITLSGTVSSSGNFFQSSTVSSIYGSDQPDYDEITSFTFEASLDSSVGGGTVTFTI